ncbi:MULTISPECIES: glycoside hydrolase family 43 protein [Niastella]|uniref:Glycoside hydrolase family 43 protein n=1 Tax=Niastella soli TaxID=2821487 RepID=A0ABS3Z4Z5_9BACT|nr:glycoside hydrolase family 43 protein [Niastella soli]MBO9205224.1 glycoside hydrolase family 43 protein [Niastella soli]
MNSKQLTQTIIFLIVVSLNTTAQTARVNNPILAGFYPDPSICRVGNDYYLVNSTFAYYPGLPVFHSTDLANWEQIGFAMDRPEQLDLDGAHVSGGLFAPTIRFNKGLYYITCTNTTHGGNFIITAKNPKGPWSNPVFLPAVKGIDPSMFFDDNGKAYIVYNSEAPDNKPQYEGHRTIRMYEVDLNTLQTKGAEIVLVNGGSDISQKPIWIEGPHLFKYNKTYYLMCAEGGTGYNHSEVIFKSKKAEGPFESYTGNPILTQRQLAVGRKRAVTSTGHADLVTTPDGSWYAVFLGCRPYSDEHYNTGRETFMAPVEWKEDWPIILPGNETVPDKVSIKGAIAKNPLTFSSDFLFRDNFKSTELNNRYEFLRTVREPWYHINSINGTLSIQLKPTTCSDKANPAFIGYRQSHLRGYASTALTFAPASSQEKAGLLVFQNENFYYYLCLSVENNQPVLQLYKGPGKSGGEPLLLSTQKIQASGQVPVQLKIQTNGHAYSFYYAEKGSTIWKLFKEGLDANYLSTHTAGGFVGCMYAMYATSNGAPTTNSAVFNYFESKGNDD